MIIKNELYFAPGVKFAELDTSGNILPDQFQKRIYGYYLEPARKAAEANDAFASGVLLVSCIDALAYFQTGSYEVGERFKNWCQCLPSFNELETRERFYLDFRNGLVHNARIKNGGEFTLESKSTVEVRGQILSINPLHLCKEVSGALDRYVKDLKANRSMRTQFIGMIVSDFSYELNN